MRRIYPSWPTGVGLQAVVLINQVRLERLERVRAQEACAGQALRADPAPLADPSDRHFVGDDQPRNPRLAATTFRNYRRQTVVDAVKRLLTKNNICLPEVSDPSRVLHRPVAVLAASTHHPAVEQRSAARLLGCRAKQYDERVDGATPVRIAATDTSFRCSAVAQLAWHTSAGNPAYEFEFARVPAGREALGATHASELSYIFGTIDRGIGGVGGRPVPANAVDTQVSDVMQQYWTNFAKTGDPNGGQLAAWPKFDATSRAYIQFTDAGPIAKEGLRSPFCDLFIENERRLKAQ